jgi:hypothetical protein
LKGVVSCHIIIRAHQGSFDRERHSPSLDAMLPVLAY